ncbi:MAG: acetyl-CoA C-acetyltransferase [Magnetococcus sp. DMHC-6]
MATSNTERVLNGIIPRCANLTKTERTRDVFVVDGCRTPFLKAMGTTGPLSGADLAVIAGRSLLLRQPITEQMLDEVILGCVLPAPEEANIARTVALRLGCPWETPAWTVQRNCASGLQAVDTAVRTIQTGEAHLILAGGVEAMSRAPLLWRSELVNWLAAWKQSRRRLDKWQLLRRLRPSLLRPVIALLKGLTDPTTGLSMGQTAEVTAHRFGILREEMDHYAMQSHLRLAKAWQADHFKEEVVESFTPDGSLFTEDQGLRRNITLEGLAKLAPVFDRFDGALTAGNSAQITDGACLLLLASAEAVKTHRLTVLGRVSPAQWVGLDPLHMGLGPVHAIQKLLQNHNLSMENIDYWEINEAFAAQVLSCCAALADPTYCQTELHLSEPLGVLPMTHLNIDGGAISVGHPVGASGARILLRLLHILKRKQAHQGIAALCIGGGQGGAMLAQSA